MNRLLDNLCQMIVPVDPGVLAEYQHRIDQLTKPKGSLGRLEEITSGHGAIRHPQVASPKRKYTFTFAADHGISRSGVSLYPREVTAQMVCNFLSGGAAISVMCRHYGIENMVVDVGVDHDFKPHRRLVSRKVGYGTRNLLEEAAMTWEQAKEYVRVGADLADEYAKHGADLVGTGDMGIGDTTASSAIFAAVTGLEPQEVTGKGTGIDGARLRSKVALIRRALDLHRADGSDPLEVLARVGGFEIGAILGLILGCASKRVPVVVDGFISTAGAVLAILACPLVKDFLFFSHRSREKGHRVILDGLGAKPLFNLDLSLGEGSGAVMLWI